MYRTLIGVIVSLSFVLALTGCAGMSPTAKGALGGAAAGAGVGALVGDEEGALIGAGVGAATGAVVGHEVERRRGTRYRP